MPGIGPMTASAGSFREFFGIDSDLVQAAAERSAVAMASVPRLSEAVRGIISAMTDTEKTAMLSRLFDGDALCRRRTESEGQEPYRESVTDATPIGARTVGELRARANAIGLAREEAAGREARRRTQTATEEAEKARQVQATGDIARRGEGVWREVEAEIERRNAAVYDKAAKPSPRSSGRSPKNAVRWLTSNSAYRLFGNDMRESNSSSCGWRRSDSLARCRDSVMAEPEGFEPSIGLYKPITV